MRFTTKKSPVLIGGAVQAAAKVVRNTPVPATPAPDVEAAQAAFEAAKAALAQAKAAAKAASRTTAPGLKVAKAAPDGGIVLALVPTGIFAKSGGEYLLQAQKPITLPDGRTLSGYILVK